MDEFQSLISMLWPYLSLPVVLGIIKVGIDSLTARDVEKVFLTNSMRINYLISKVVVLTMLTFSLFAVVLYSELFKGEVVAKALVTAMVLFIFSLLITFIIYFYITIIYFIFGVKSKYKIIQDDREWFVIRRVNKDTVLLANGRDAKFIDWQQIKNETIKREIKEYMNIVPLQYIVKKPLPYYITLFLLSLGLIAYMNIVGVEKANNIYVYLFTLFLYTLLLLSFIAWNNKKLINENHN